MECNLNLSGGSLAIDWVCRLDGGLNFSDGTVMGAGDLTVLGSLMWTGGTMSGSGDTIVGGTATVSGNHDSFNLNPVLDGRTLENDGTLTVKGTRDFQTRNRAV